MSAPTDGAPGMEMVAPCVCSDCTRAVFALTAETASVGLGSAEKAIGGGSPPLRRSQAWDRQPGAARMIKEPKNQRTKEKADSVPPFFGSSVLWFFDFFS